MSSLVALALMLRPGTPMRPGRELYIYTPGAWEA